MLQKTVETVKIQKPDNGQFFDDKLTAVLASIQDISKLSSTITFYIPQTGKEQKLISQRRFEKRTVNVARQFAKLFGGSTVTYGSGFWLDSNGHLINERINQVTSNTDPLDLAEHYETVLDLAEKYRVSWQQETIALNVDGTLLLLD